MGWLTRTPWHWSIAENVYFPLNLPEGTVQGPLSFSGENVNFRWRYCLTIFGTLHHQGSMKGLRNDLQTKNKVRSASTFYSSIVSEVNETIVTWDHRQGRDKHRILWRSRPTEWRPSVLSADPCWSRVRPGRRELLALVTSESKQSEECVASLCCWIANISMTIFVLVLVICSNINISDITNGQSSITMKK